MFKGTQATYLYRSHKTEVAPLTVLLTARRHTSETNDYWCLAKLECGPMTNVMVALPNIGGALCSMPQSLADAHYLTAVQ